jgi:polar amino acid transport system substrate-binding protein
VAGVAIAMLAMQAVPSTAGTLDRIREAHKMVLGYRADALPFSGGEASAPTGYSVGLCVKVAEEVQSALGLSELTVEWVPLTVDDRFAAIEQGSADLVCGADAITLERRGAVSFSIPIYPNGIAAMLRADAPWALQDVLAGKAPSGPIWRASPAQILQEKTFAVVKDTRSDAWLSQRLKDFELSASVVQVDSYEAGVQAVLGRSADVFFGDRAILVDAAAKSAEASDLVILERLYTSEPSALTLARNDDDFRLVVDRALSRYYRTPEFKDLYGKWFGAPDEAAAAFFRHSEIPE